MITRTEKRVFSYIESGDANKFLSAYQMDELVDKKTCNKDGISILGYAVQNNMVDIINYLTTIPGEINRLDSSGKTPGSYIPESNNIELINILKQKGADFSFLFIDGRNVLHKSAMLRGKDMFLALIKAGANPHQKDNQGETPLDVAKRYQNTEVINLYEKKPRKSTELEQLPR